MNLELGKNLAGTFHQPALVLADTGTLGTLEEAEWLSGLGEVIKSRLIGDEQLVIFIEENIRAIGERAPEALGEIVERSVRVKSRVVEADEREGGERKKLNLGHTFGHAIEKVAGFGKIPHGIAVATGLALALRASAKVGLLTEESLAERLGRLLAQLGLPRTLDELRSRYGAELPASELAEAMRLDKKAQKSAPRFVLLGGVGDVRLDVQLDSACLAEILG